MYNNLVKYIFASIIIVSVTTSCKKLEDFGTDYITNPDPNVNTMGKTNQLFTNAILRAANVNNTNVSGANTANAVGDYTTSLYVQYLTEIGYVGIGLYNQANSDWNALYSGTGATNDITNGPLMDLKYIINYNTDESTKAAAAVNGSNNNQLASARILRAFLFMRATDKWGDIPYFDANNGNIHPSYTKQQAIYTDLFKELKEAVDQFDNGVAFKGDVLFNGNQAKWKKLANSLRMIMALRLSKVDPATGKLEFLSAYNHTAGYISTNADNAAFTYQNNVNYRSPWYVLRNVSNDNGISDFFVNLLKNYADPRLSKYADPATTTPTVSYVGAPYGLTQVGINNWVGGNKYSEIGSAYTQTTSPGYFCTASQMLLTVSEAGLRGWITGTTPKTDYENGIRASFAQAGITDVAMINMYIATANVTMNPSDVGGSINKVALQKYIALFPNSLETYSEWRRTGIPALTPASAANNPSKQIPRRFGYPVNEPLLNSTNYEAAIAVMGSNSTDTRVWWDKP